MLIYILPLLALKRSNASRNCALSGKTDADGTESLEGPFSFITGFLIEQCLINS